MKLDREAGQVRLAVKEDAVEIVRLRALMFREMGGNFLTASDEWEEKCVSFLENHLDSVHLVGAVIDSPDGSGLAASGLAEISQRIPSPHMAHGSHAYLSSVCTDPLWRRRGYARSVVSFLIEQARNSNVSRVDLHATSDGVHLYRQLGFAERIGGPEMRLVLSRIG